MATNDEQARFTAGQRVRVKPHTPESEDWQKDYALLEKAEWQGVIGHIVEWTHSPNTLRVDFMGGRLWFSADDLEQPTPTAPAQDAQIAALTQALAAREAALERAEKRADDERETRIKWGRERQTALDEAQWIKSGLKPFAEYARVLLRKLDLEGDGKPKTLSVMRLNDVILTTQDFENAVYWYDFVQSAAPPPVRDESEGGL